MSNYTAPELKQVDELQLAEIKSLIKEGAMILKKTFLVEDENGTEIEKNFMYIPLQVASHLRNLLFRINLTVKDLAGNVTTLQAYKTTSIGISVSSLGEAAYEIIAVE